MIMPDNRGSHGIPVPTLWHVLMVVATACAGWLIWSEFRSLGPSSNSRHEAAEIATEAALNTLRSIEALGKDSGEGIPELTRSLTDPDAKVRGYALLALRRLGPQARVALDPICERLADVDATVREYAVDAYWNIRQDADAVTQAIVARLGDDEERVRSAAAKVLERIGPPGVPAVVEMLESDSAAARVAALNILRRIGWDRSRSEVDEAVRKRVDDADPAVRAVALRSIVLWGRPRSGEIRDLLAQPVGSNMDPMGQLADAVFGPQATALNAIIRLGPEAAGNLPDVVGLFDEKPNSAGERIRRAREAPEDQLLRMAATISYTRLGMALAALRSMKAAARPAVPRLFELFDESTGTYRFEIAWTLIEIGADRQNVIDRLLPLLADPDGDNCHAAGCLLAYASAEEGRRQVAALIPQISPDQIAAHPWALHAISGMARVAQEAVPALTILLEHPLDDYSYWRLVDTLGAIGADAGSAVPALAGLLARDPASLKFSTRLAIIGSLGTLGPAARQAIPVLISELSTITTHHISKRELKYAHSRGLRAVIMALTLIDGRDPAVLAALRTQLTSDDADASNAALDALLQLSPDSPHLLAELLNRRPRVNLSGPESWIFAVGRMTCGRQSAIGPLTDALRDPDPQTRKLGAWVLGRLGSDANAALPALHDALSDWENSLYEPRSAMQASHEFRLRKEILGRSRSRSWQSFFEPRSGELLQFEARSVRDAVREAISKIDSTAHGPATAAGEE
jgi:HEAT repeat protein